MNSKFQQDIFKYNKMTACYFVFLEVNLKNKGRVRKVQEDNQL